MEKSFLTPWCWPWHRAPCSWPVVLRISPEPASRLPRLWAVVLYSRPTGILQTSPLQLKLEAERIFLGTRKKRDIEMPPPRSSTFTENPHNDTPSEVSYTMISFELPGLSQVCVWQLMHLQSIFLLVIAWAIYPLRVWFTVASIIWFDLGMLYQHAHHYGLTGRGVISYPVFTLTTACEPWNSPNYAFN